MLLFNDYGLLVKLINALPYDYPMREGKGCCWTAVAVGGLIGFD